MNNQVRGSLNAIFPLESLSLEPSVPFLSAALLWDWDLPLTLTWAFLPLSLLPFSLHPLLSFPALCVSFFFPFPLHCRGAHLLAVFRQMERETCVSENILILLSYMIVRLSFSD